MVWWFIILVVLIDVEKMNLQRAPEADCLISNPPGEAGSSVDDLEPRG